MGYVNRIKTKIENLQKEIEVLEKDLKKFNWIEDATEHLLNYYHTLEKEDAEDIIETIIDFMNASERDGAK